MCSAVGSSFWVHVMPGWDWVVLDGFCWVWCLVEHTGDHSVFALGASGLVRFLITALCLDCGDFDESQVSSKSPDSVPARFFILV